MAKRRMFSLDVVDTDRFLEMPPAAQALYFNLGMRADDDGFVASPKKITKACGCSMRDLRVLIAASFIVPFESGVCHIIDWKRNNYIAKDRYTPSIHTQEKTSLESGADKEETQNIQSVYSLNTQVSIGKDSIGKDSTGKVSTGKDNTGEQSEGEISEEEMSAQEDSQAEADAGKAGSPHRKHYGYYRNVLLSDKEYDRLRTDYTDLSERIERLSEYLAVSGRRYRSHFAVIRTWARKDSKDEQNAKQIREYIEESGEVL